MQERKPNNLMIHYEQALGNSGQERKILLMEGNLRQNQAQSVEGF